VGEVEEGGEKIGVKGSAAPVARVELPGAAVAADAVAVKAVAVKGEDEGSGVGVAPIYAAEEVGPDGRARKEARDGCRPRCHRRCRRGGLRRRRKDPQKSPSTVGASSLAKDPVVDGG